MENKTGILAWIKWWLESFLQNVYQNVSAKRLPEKKFNKVEAPPWCTDVWFYNLVEGIKPDGSGVRKPTIGESNLELTSAIWWWWEIHWKYVIIYPYLYLCSSLITILPFVETFIFLMIFPCTDVNTASPKATKVNHRLISKESRP